jgi:glycosyltransferase involved in cell wall biosynthesis
MQRVSCLLVTAERFECFKQSFKSYCLQQYEDKELVIACASSKSYQETLREYVARSGRQDVIFAFTEGNLTLGQLRNLSIEAASGPIVCQWDDDDVYHPSRIAIQASSLIANNAQASYLVENLHLFSESSDLYWCNWDRSLYSVGHPGSLVGYKKSLPRYNDALSKHEDLDIQRRLIRNQGSTSVLSGHPHLYIYVYHGKNTFGFNHHRSTVRMYGLEADTLRARRSALTAMLNEHASQSDVVRPPLKILDNGGNLVFEWTGLK